MKNHCLFIFISGFLVAQAAAQPVITNATFTNSGTVLDYDTATPLWNATLNPEAIQGPNVTWDYSTFEIGALVNETYVAVSATPLSYQFFFNNQILYPNSFSNHALPVNIADLGLPIPIDVTDPYAFYRNSSGGYFATGYAATVDGFPFPLSIPYTEADRIYKFPVNYGESDATSSSFSITVPTFGYYGQDAVRNNSVDGWGTLITPNGTYEALRVRSERFITDTIYLEQEMTGQIIERPVQIDYAWLTVDVAGPVMQVTTIAGQVTTARILSGDGPNNVNQVQLQGISIFPNPSNGILHVGGLDRSSALRLYSAEGKMVLNKTTDSENFSLDISHLPAGMYILQVNNSSGSFTDRIVITK